MSVNCEKFILNIHFGVNFKQKMYELHYYNPILRLMPFYLVTFYVSS